MVIEQIAAKMTEKSKKYVDSLEKELKELVTGIYESQIPEEIRKVFKSHSEYIETTGSVVLDGHGFNRENVSMTKQLPATSNYNQKLKLTAAISDRIMAVKRKKDKAKEDFRTLLSETEAALTALRTYKNIRENLPEAAQYLPPPMSNALVVSFDSLQKRLRKQPEILKPAIQ